MPISIILNMERMISSLYAIPAIHLRLEGVFTNTVPVGSRIRMKMQMLSCEQRAGGGHQVTNQFTIEIEGQERPACVAEVVSLVFPA